MMKAENDMRRRETNGLLQMLEKEKEKLAENLSRETSQVRDIIENERKSRTDNMLQKDKEVKCICIPTGR